MNKAKQFTKISDILSRFNNKEEDKYISREFQKYGYDLAEELGDVPRQRRPHVQQVDHQRRVFEVSLHDVLDRVFATFCVGK